MEKLNLTDKEANMLIDMFKHLIDKHNIHLVDGSNGALKVESKNIDITGNHHKFKVDYMYSLDNIHIQLRDCNTDYTLVRINLDTSFHKNSDGNIVRGNRVEIFSEQEFKNKLKKNRDTTTHVKAYPLPFKGINNTNDFLLAISDLFDYTNIEKPNAPLFTINGQLFN